MDLNELKQAWTEFDARLERLELDRALRVDEFREGRLRRIRRGLWPLAAGQLAQMAAGIGVIVLAVGYWTEQLAVPHRWLMGVVVHAYGVLMIVCSGIVLGKLRGIDYSSPVLEIQRRLSDLRKWYVRGGIAVGLPWWLLWIPFFQVVFGRLGVDLCANLDGLWLGSCVALGVFGLVATWAFDRWVRRPGREQLARRLDDGAAGQGITRARDLLDELARFEQE